MTKTLNVQVINLDNNYPVADSATLSWDGKVLSLRMEGDYFQASQAMREPILSADTGMYENSWHLLEEDVPLLTETIYQTSFDNIKVAEDLDFWNNSFIVKTPAGNRMALLANPGSYLQFLKA